MDLTREWFTAPDIAAMAMPGIPNVPANVRALAERERWQRAEWSGIRWRVRKEKGGGVEYHYSVLSAAARNAWIAAFTPIGEAAEWKAAQNAGATSSSTWSAYWAAGETLRTKALRRLQIVLTVCKAIESGRPRTGAVLAAAAEFEVGKSAIYQWLGLTDGVPRSDWVPALLPQHKGRRTRSDCSPEAWQALYTAYARQSQPRFTDCYRDITKAAKANGWTVPSEDTLWRRMQEVPPETLVLARQGKQAIKRMFPALERDRRVFHALQAVNADGHKWDVMVRWPDGYVGRPMMLAFQDLYSDFFLSWRVDRTENQHLIQRAFGDLVETYGIPELCYLDNGRGFTAKSLTGGIKNRFRYKYREEEPEGVLKQLGVDVRFTLPYSGQSKPIERGFGDFAGRIAKDIRFECAYVGNCPDARPEDFDPKKAVALDLFLQVIAEGIQEHNERAGRRTAACEGKLSFKQAFDASYVVSPIRKAHPDQKPLWLLAAENIRPRNPDSAIHFYGNRYWAKFLQDHTGKSLTVRFDPDALHEDLFVYNWDGKFLGKAECKEAVGFNDVAAAREQARARSQYFRNARAVDDFERGEMTRERLIALTKTPMEASPPPQTKVIRPTFGNTALKARPEEQPDEFVDLFVQRMEEQRAQRASPWLAFDADGD